MLSGSTIFFAVNDITDAEKKSLFLAVIGPTTYVLLRNLFSPAKPGKKSYDDLVKMLKDHFNLTLLETLQHSWFNSQFRKSDETVTTFVAELRRKRSKYCITSSLLCI